MLYSEFVWHLVRILSWENPIDEVSEDLVLGRRLRASEVPSGISNYVDLTAETEDLKTVRDSQTYVTFPILDAGVPDGRALAKALSVLRPGKTFVHCAQGHGRTGLFALALLAAGGQIGSFEEGMEKLNAVRPGLVLNGRQEAFMKEYLGEQMHAEATSKSARGGFRSV
jgi:protein-tyrosine phosphatase